MPPSARRGRDGGPDLPLERFSIGRDPVALMTTCHRTRLGTSPESLGTVPTKGTGRRYRGSV